MSNPLIVVLILLSFGQIVNRYVNDNWKWCKRSNQAATAQRRQYKFHSRGAAETLVKQMGSLELPIKTEACEQALLECDYDMEKASMKLMREYGIGMSCLFCAYC